MNGTLIRIGFGIVLVGSLTGLFAQVGGFGGFGQASGSMLNVGGMNPAGPTPFSIRPWVMVNGTYSANLTPEADGSPLAPGTYGAMGAYGVGGQKAWQRTTFGVNLSGIYRPKLDNAVSSFYANTLSIGVSHLLGPRTRVSAAAFGGYSSGGMGFGAGAVGGGLMIPFGFGSMLQMGSVDFGNPMENGIVDRDVFDVGTLFTGVTSSIVHQLSPRWSVGGGGGSFLARRRYAGLSETYGFSGYGFTSYSLNRTTSIGVQYAEQHFSYRNLFGGNRAQSASFFLRKALSQTVTTGFSLGTFRFRSEFIGVIPIDPALSELLGGFATNSYEVRSVDRIGGIGNGFISKSYRRGFVSLNGGRSLMPGNGVMLTSVSDSVNLYATTTIPGGFALGGMALYSRLSGVQQQGLRSEFYTAAGSISRPIKGGFWATANGGYRAVDFTNSRTRRSYFIGVGIAWMPQDAVLMF
jgi:hypothetical protein